MGRTITPPYYVEAVINGRRQTLSYDVKRDGKPSDEAAERLRQAYNRSFKPGGSNYHITEATGQHQHVSRLAIIRNTGPTRGAVAGEAQMPMFEVI